MAAVDRILDGARGCFARKGYAGTTIADIEAAAGYTPRAGGVYRHFASKEAILEAVIDRELASNERAILQVEAPPATADPRVLLAQVARRGLAQLDAQSEFISIVFRDLDQFPVLLERVRRGLTDATYRDFADRLEVAHTAGRVPAMDFEAVALLAIGPVVDFKMKQHLLGYTPLDLDEDRLVAAWVEMFARVFGIEEQGD